MRYPAPLGLLRVGLPLAAQLLLSPASSADTLEQTIETGATAYALGRLESARVSLEQAIERHPGHFTTLRWL